MVKVNITEEMIDLAINNVKSKLDYGEQVVKVYNKNSNDNQYYINNIIGEIGELALAKYIENSGYELGVNPHMFAPFKKTDVGDLFASKTGKTIDVKTVAREGSVNLIINKSMANWREVYNYVLVNLVSDYPVNENSLYEIKYADILGSLTDSTVKKNENIRTMYGKDVYFISSRKLTPIDKMIDSHFIKKNEGLKRYYSKGKINLEIASLTKGPVNKENNQDIQELISKYSDEGNGHYNFIPMNIDNRKIVSFSIYDGKFISILFIKALLEAAAQANKSKLTLVIPSYIEWYLPIKDKRDIIKIIDNLKCDVEYIWSHNSTF